MKHNNVPHSNHFPSTMASGFGQSALDPYNVYSNIEDYLTRKTVVKTTP
jgi:hypothetical protein